MASINVRKETGKLYFDFRFRNQRCREQSDLKDTVLNRKRMQIMLDKIQAEIMLGQFDYRATFPNSNMLQKLDAAARIINVANAQVPTTGRFAELWLNESKVQWRDSHTVSVLHIVEQRIIPFFKDIPVDKITKQQILEFRAQVCALKKRNGDSLAPSTINRHLKLLRSIMVEASDRFGFTTSYRSIKPLKVPKTHIQPFSPDEITLLLDNCREDFYEYFLIRFFTGVRTSEVDGLKWKYVDLENRLILIRETIVNGKVSYTKNDFSQRDIQMSESVFDAFVAMKARTGSYEFVFVNNNGNPLIHKNVTNRVWYPLLRLIGLPKRNPYQTRHSTATLWLASGESPEWIANQMGHSNTEMLFRVYSRYVPNLTRQDGSAANKMFSSVIGGGNHDPKLA
jgi:integrase